MQKRLLSYALLAASAASAAIIDEVRAAISQNDFALGESHIQAYRTRNGVTPEMLAAMSWLGRGALAAKQLDKAEVYARQVHQLATAELSKRRLDDDVHLPIALGAAIEVQGQVLAARGERDSAVLFLRNELRTYRATSIRTRIQKNINLLTLEGKPAPALNIATYLGSKPQPLAALKGKPVLLFFWAHWCGDCKKEVPLLAKLLEEYNGRFHLVAPTQHYGYVAEGAEAPPAAEFQYIEQVRQKYYARLGNTPIPVNDETFKNYGCSTTPTLVFVDRLGIVRLYHPGGMSYEELRAALEKLLTT